MVNVIGQGYDASYPPLDEDHFHAYFSHPSEIEPLLRAAGLEMIGAFAVEGFVSMIDTVVNTLEGEAWDAWVDLNLRLTSEPSLLSCAEHLLALGKKPSAIPTDVNA